MSSLESAPPPRLPEKRPSTVKVIATTLGFLLALYALAFRDSHVLGVAAVLTLFGLVW